LRRRHVENYLLDSLVLSEVAKTLYLSPEKRNRDWIDEEIKKIASSCLMQGTVWNVREHLKILGALAQPSLRNVDEMSPDDVVNTIAQQIEVALSAIANELDAAAIKKLVLIEHSKLKASLASDDWIKLLPGKMIFNRFCGGCFGVEAERVREAYTDIAMEKKPDVFADIIEMFKTFKGVVSPA